MEKEFYKQMWENVPCSSEHRIVLYQHLLQSANRDRQHYFDLWIEQLKLSDKLRKYLLLVSICNSIDFLCIIVLIFI